MPECERPPRRPSPSKVMALVLAAFMALAVATPAWAADGDPTYTITIDNSANASANNTTINGKKYTAYKLFDLTYANTGTTADNDQNPHSYSIDSDGDGSWAWGTLTSGLTADSDGVYTSTTYGLKMTPSASDPTVYVVQPLDSNGFNAEKARALADALTNVTKPAGVESTVAANETATITLPAPGYYAVYGSADPKDQASSEEVVAALALTSTDPAATVNPKVKIPTLDKEITKVTEATASGTQEVSDAILDEDGKAAVAKVGSTVSYKLTSAVPDLVGFSDYTFTFTDSISAGLDYVKTSFVLKIGGAAPKVNNVEVAINPVFAEGDKSFTLTIPYNVLKAYAKDTAITLEYNATVNSGALTTDYENNTAKLTYSNNPGSNTTNDTPEKKTYVIDINLDVDKVAGSATGSKLDGATFLLYRMNGNTEEYYKWDATANKVTWVAKASADQFVTDAQGKLTQQVRGLDKGTYYLLETVAPKGYNLLPDPVTVTITPTEAEDGNSVTYASTNATVTNGTVDLTDAHASAGKQPVATPTIINNAGTELPSTGGMGTRILYTIGGAMIVAGGIYLVAKRRLSAME